VSAGPGPVDRAGPQRARRRPGGSRAGRAAAAAALAADQCNLSLAVPVNHDHYNDIIQVHRDGVASKCGPPARADSTCCGLGPAAAAGRGFWVAVGPGPGPVSRMPVPLAPLPVLRAARARRTRTQRLGPSPGPRRGRRSPSPASPPAARGPGRTQSDSVTVTGPARSPVIRLTEPTGKVALSHAQACQWPPRKLNLPDAAAGLANIDLK
jgi:hypothetical protein